MGFQSGINKVLGAGAAAAYTIATEKEKASEEYDLAKSQAKEASSQIKEIKSSKEYKETGEDLGKKEEALKAVEKEAPGESASKELKEAYEQKHSKALTERDAAKIAFEALSDKIEAKQALISRAEKIMKRTSKWGGIK